MTRRSRYERCSRAGAYILVLAAALLLWPRLSYCQTATTQEQIKDQIVKRLGDLAAVIDQQANKATITSGTLAAQGPQQLPSILSQAEHSDPTIASVVPKSGVFANLPDIQHFSAFANSILHPSNGAHPEMTAQQLVNELSQAKKSATAELNSRAALLSGYANKLRALQQEILNSSSNQALTKLDELPMPPRIAELVFDPAGEAVPPSSARAHQISAAANGSPLSLTRFIVGSGDASVDFPSVGAVLFRNSQGDLQEACTGTLIAPAVVLTAAHCLGVKDAAGTTHQPFGVYFQHSGFHPLDPSRAPVQYPHYDGEYQGDLAVLYISDPIFEIAPASLNAIGRVKPGTVARIVGFGYHNALGIAGSPPDASDNLEDTTGIKLWGHIVTNSCPGQTHLICWTYSKKPTDATYGSTCEGDSGGPLFVQSGSSWLLAGVTLGSTTKGLKACEPGAAAIDVEVFDFLSWIEASKGTSLTNTSTVRLQELDALDNPDSRYAVEIADSIFQPAAPSFSKNFTLSTTDALVRVTLNSTARPIGVSTALHMEVSRDGSAAVCSVSNDDPYVVCNIPAPLAPGGNWLVKVSGAPTQEFQVVATEFHTN